MKALLGAAALALGLGLGAQAMACELDRPLKMAGLDYDSAAFHTALASAIAERGFGCKVERVPGVIAPLAMHSTALLAATSLLLMFVGLGAWLYLHHRWPEIGRTATQG